MSVHNMEEIFHPQAIAIVGASGNTESQGYSFVEALVEHGFKGAIYPVNPKYGEILGHKAYPRVSDIPGPVDYVISSVPAPQVPSMLADCARKGVRVVHLYTARFSETGRKDAAELEKEVLRLAREHGIRLIGPNCMGLHYPSQGISFWSILPKQSGSAGLISQSGQVVGEITRNSALRNVYFNKAISYGNALDFNEVDFLDYMTQDQTIDKIFMYVEGLRNGRQFFESLRRATARKPVVILKGGRGESGARATASHTASLAGSSNIWETAIAQAGAISVNDLEELIDMVVSFEFLPPFTGRRVGVSGGAGGASVLAADQCEENGLDVVPLPDDIREEMKRREISIWDWLGNPADLSIRESRDFLVGDIFKMMDKSPGFDLLIALMGEGGRGNRAVSAEEFLTQYKLSEIGKKPLLAVIPERGLTSENYADSMWKTFYEVRKALHEQNIPYYPTIGRAARAASRMAAYYRRRG